MVENNKANLDNIRHSCAHLLAAAVKTIWKGAKNAIGPAIENGFYQDFDMGDVKVSETDLEKIEDKMREILKSWKAFEVKEVSVEQARKDFADNPYKLELIEDFAKEGKTITENDPGNFLDLCKGGHSQDPQEELRHFKLLSIAGAYWRGSEKNKMLTRVYGTAFENQEKLDEYLQLQEEAKKRDHRRLGQDLDLFSTNPLTGAGLILWHPKLSITRNIVEQMWKDEHYKRGYQLVFTPHIASMDMFVISRHLSKYINSMFPVMLHQYIEGESAPDYSADEVLKPMNCPNHIQIYKSRIRSYKELPLRMGELGTVYRYERAGVLHGMTRVRGFTQDDSHLFCRPDQVLNEVKGILDLTKFFYKMFGFSDYKAYIATRPEKYLGSLDMWESSQKSLEQALIDKEIPYQIDEGEGVFYGPKIDIKVKDSLGREWQLGTIQFDFNQPDKAETTDEEIEEFWNLKTFKEKFKTKEALTKYLKKLGRGFDVNFINKEGKDERVIMIHRTVLGSMERFFGILIEHYGGVFPAWLSPVQVKIIPISEKHLEYAQKVLEQLNESNIRVELDDRSETMQAKIRDAQMQKIPYMLIMGDLEVNDKSVSVRTRDGRDLKAMNLKEFIGMIEVEISEKR